MDMVLLDIIWLHNIALVLGEETDNQEVASLNKFEYQHQILDESFFTFLCCLNVVLEKTKNMKKI